MKGRAHNLPSASYLAVRGSLTLLSILLTPCVIFNSLLIITSLNFDHDYREGGSAMKRLLRDKPTQRVDTAQVVYSSDQCPPSTCLVSPKVLSLGPLRGGDAILIAQGMRQ